MKLRRAAMTSMLLLFGAFSACGGRTELLGEQRDATGGSSAAEPHRGKPGRGSGGKASIPEKPGQGSGGGAVRPSQPATGGGGGSGGTTQPETSDGGQVNSGGMGGANPLVCDPSDSESCDDGNDCTVDECGASGCSHLDKPNGSACESGDAEPSGDRCELGICVNGPPGIPGDVDGNGCVDQADYDVIAGSYNRSVGEGGADPRADFNGDDWVDFLDYLDLYDHWLEGC